MRRQFQPVIELRFTIMKGNYPCCLAVDNRGEDAKSLSKFCALKNVMVCGIPNSFLCSLFAIYIVFNMHKYKQNTK